MKNHQDLTLLFWHRKSKQDKKGYAPVICRISIEGQEPEEISFGAKVHIDEWDLENKKAIPKNPIIKFKCGADEKEIPPLEYFEVETIWTKEIKIQILATWHNSKRFFTGQA